MSGSQAARERAASLSAPAGGDACAPGRQPGPDAGPHPLILALGDAGIGFLQRGEDGFVRALNTRFCELVGLSSTQLHGTGIDALFHPSDRLRGVDLYDRHLVEARPFEIETRYVRPDGTISCCALSFSFPREPAGGATSLVVIAQDITGQRVAEQALLEHKADHRSAIELAPQINWTASATGMVEEVSARWSEVTGTDPEDALGVGWLNALHGDDVAPTVGAWTTALENRRPVDVEYRLRTRLGTFRWFRARASARLNANGDVVRWYGTLENIDDRKEAERGLRESEERFRLAAQAAGIGIWDYDSLRDRREWSDEFKDMLGLPRNAPADAEVALALVVESDRHLLRRLINAVRRGDSSHHFDVTLRIRRADNGVERWMRTSGWRIQAPSGPLERILVTVRDVTDERTAEARIRWMATHDGLTGLPNRSHFTEAFEAALGGGRGRESGLALALFDVDNLKSTNDSIGHDAGDILLQTCGKRIVAALGPDAFVGRLGGDEFAAFFQTKNEARLHSRIETVLDALRLPFDHHGGTLDCQATVGTSIYPRDGGRAADLLKAADIALYAGKAKERGALSVFRPEMRANLQRRASMLGLARTVLREDRIIPFYQPKVSLANGRLTGFEALLRWHDPTLGVQTPHTISAALEDYTLAFALGERMLDRICRDIRGWLDRGLEFGSVALNLSSAEFRRDDLCGRILERLKRDQIPPRLIEVEITESVLLGRDLDQVSQTLDAFHRAGVRIALDDFGTGYASLTHLQSFPVDVIKIDRSFVSDIGDGGGNAAIVDAVIGLANRLGMDVVAEGVETLAQATYLSRRGCAFGQGFLFGRAVPAKKVGGIIRKWSVTSQKR